MPNKTHEKIRYLVLLVGAVFFVLPRYFTELDLIYVLSPWIYLTSFLYFTRTSRRFSWLAFSFVYLIVHEIRYERFLGDYETAFTWISLVLLILLTIFDVIPFLLDRYYQKRGKGFLMPLVFPFMRIVVEQFVIGKQFNLALSQFGNKWLIQSAAYVGDIFVSFIVAFVPSVVVWMIIRKDDRKIRTAGSIMLAVCAVIFLLGGIRYSTYSIPDNAVLMGYASGPVKTYYEFPSEEDAGYAENAAYLEKTAREASEKGARLMAYAEEAFIVYGQEEENLIHEAQKVARDNGIFILMSLDVTTEEEEGINKIVFIDDKGNYLSDYAKTYLIPVIESEDYIPGDGIIPADLVTMSDVPLVISYSICYDATFSEYLLSMNSDTQLFINPSWDWEEVKDLNYRLQGISALESGVVLFKPTVDGWSIVVDPYGRLLYKENTMDGDYDLVRYANVPSARVKTIYPQIYDASILVWALLILSVLVVLINLMVHQFVQWIRSRA